MKQERVSILIKTADNATKNADLLYSFIRQKKNMIATKP